MTKVTGNVRESADGLRGRSADASKARLREARARVAQEAAAKRKGETVGGRPKHGRLS